MSSDFKLASDVCAAIQEGDDSRLRSVLHIDQAVEPAVPTKEDETPSSSTRVISLLHIFYHLIGHGDCINKLDREVRYDVSVKANLVLRALLKASSYDSSLSFVSWQAATAAILSLQFTNGKNNSGISHTEELKMVAEIRSFLSSNVQSITFPNKTKQKVVLLDQSLEQLLLLGQAIIAPLLRSTSIRGLKEETNENNATAKSIRSRREISYLLPLELIPVIVSVADTLDEIRAETSINGDFAENVDPKEERDEDMGIKFECDEAYPFNETRDIDPKSTVSETLLRSLFASHTDEIGGLEQRSMRADAALPILALAIDDIGSVRMSSICQTFGRTSTYWKCLRSALNDAISSSIMCCTEEKDFSSKSELTAKQIVMREETKSDEGVHIIPHSDYPALIRCIFRMIAARTTDPPIDQSTSHSWESLLIRSYHAAIVTTLSPNIAWSKKHRDMDRMSILSTVESHVLIPTFTSASVLSIRSVLNACTTECCPRCRNDACEADETQCTSSVPPFAVAGFVLLIMRARTSTISHSLTNNAAGFGPRSVFRLASKILSKDTDIPGVEAETGFDGEFEMALKILLNLSGVESGSCPVCSDGKDINGAEIAAYEMLRGSYYGGDGKFIPRHKNSATEEPTFKHQLGISTLSSYASLIRSSLTHGLRLDEKHVVESFIADTSRTWLEAAMMLLDDVSKVLPNEKTNGKGKGTSTSNSIAFSAAVVVVIFCEVPSSQHDIIRSLYDRLLSPATREHHGSYCLTLVSILVWSIASRDEDTPSLEVFRRKDDKHRHNMSIFEPLCSLLLRPIVSSEQNCMRSYAFSNNDNETPLTHGYTLQLARSLISVPSAREHILSMAKKHMKTYVIDRSDANPSMLMNPFLESMPCTQASNRDALYFAAACLCILIENCSQSSYLDDCGCEALVIITDLIVLHRPSSSSSSTQLPGRVVSWVLAELESSIDRISEWACQRILRACFCALLKCYTLEQGPEKLRAIVAMTSNNADLVGLLRLSTAICSRLNGSSGPAKRSINLHVLVTLLPRDQGQVAAALMDEGFSVLNRGFARCDESATIAVDRALLTLFSQGAGSWLSNNTVVPEWSPTSQSQLVERYLFDAEHFYYSQRGGRTEHSASHFPNWIQGYSLKDEQHVPPVHMLQQKRTIGSDDKTNHAVSSLCDLFVELLVGGLVAKETQNAEMSLTTLPCESEIICNISILWAKRPKSTVASFSEATTCRLIDVYSRRLQLLLKADKTNIILAELEDTIKHALDFCKKLITKGNSCNQTQYASIWDLYNRVADENASRALISIIQRVACEHGWASSSHVDTAITKEGANESTFSLTSIASHDILDEQIYYIRTSILSSLSGRLGAGFETIMLAPAEKLSLIGLLTKSLRKLCTDFCDGFQGQSGGMRKSLVLLYAEAIDGCINNIDRIVDTISAGMLRDCTPIFGALNEATVIMWNSFCENSTSFAEASLVKATLKVCVQKLPALIRKIETTAGQSIDTNQLLMPCIVLLEQCLSKTLNKRRAASDGVDEKNTMSENCVDPDDLSQYPITQLLKPDFVSSSAVGWAYNIAFTAMTSIWNESNKIILTTIPKRHVSNEMTYQYAKRRIGVYQSLHSSLCKMFSRLELPNAITASEAEQDMQQRSNELTTNNEATLAANLLSHRGKSHLCSCIEAMSLALNSSIKTIINHFTHPARQENSRLIESLACAIGCSSSIVLQHDNLYDVITSPTRWFGAESQAGNYSLLHRLSTLIYRSESIGFELQNLRMIVQGLNERNPDDPLMLKLNEMAFPYTPNGESSLAFIQLLEQCARIVQLRLESLRKASTATGLFSDDDASDSESNNASLGRKRRHQGFAHSRRSHRTPLRSRNETIDDWLTLDDTDFARTTGETYNVDDAFVDLEDFIVEG